MTLKTPVRFLAVCLGVYIIQDALFTYALYEDGMCRTGLGLPELLRKPELLSGLGLIGWSFLSSVTERVQRSFPHSFPPDADATSAPVSKPGEEP